MGQNHYDSCSILVGREQATETGDGPFPVLLRSMVQSTFQNAFIACEIAIIHRFHDIGGPLARSSDGTNLSPGIVRGRRPV